VSAVRETLPFAVASSPATSGNWCRCHAPHGRRHSYRTDQGNAVLDAGSPPSTALTLRPHFDDSGTARDGLSSTNLRRLFGGARARCC